MMKIGFYLLGRKGYEVLKEIIKCFDKKIIAYVVIGKDKNIKKDYSNEIEKICIENEIFFYFRNEEIEIKENYKIAIGWRWIIKEDSNLIVLHDSLLPKYRGFAPLVNALINGEKRVGVTALFANREYDKGNIIYQEILDITYPKKIEDLIENISKLYINIVSEILNKLKKNNILKSYEQKEQEATYSLWRDDDDYYINWKRNADEIERFVNAVGFPYLGARTYLKKQEIVIEEVEKIQDIKIEDRETHIGKIIFMNNGEPVVICGKGLIKIKKATFRNSNESIFPLKSFRIRFENK